MWVQTFFFCMIFFNLIWIHDITCSPVIGQIPPLANVPAITAPLSQLISWDESFKEWNFHFIILNSGCYMFRQIYRNTILFCNKRTWKYKSITLFTSVPSGKHCISFMKWAKAKLRSDELKTILFLLMWINNVVLYWSFTTSVIEIIYDTEWRLTFFLPDMMYCWIQHTQNQPISIKNFNGKQFCNEKVDL